MASIEDIGRIIRKQVLDLKISLLLARTEDLRTQKTIEGLNLLRGEKKKVLKEETFHLEGIPVLEDLQGTMVATLVINQHTLAMIIQS